MPCHARKKGIFSACSRVSLFGRCWRMRSQMLHDVSSRHHRHHHRQACGKANEMAKSLYVALEWMRRPKQKKNTNVLSFFAIVRINKEMLTHNNLRIMRNRMRIDIKNSSSRMKTIIKAQVHLPLSFVLRLSSPPFVRLKQTSVHTNE